MTKLTDTLKATRPIRKFTNYQPEPYKYKIPLPPVLRNRVSNSGESSQKAVCIQEMSIMLACWKKNEFEQRDCSKEISQFNQCILQAKEANRKLKEAVQHGRTIEGSGRQPSSQVNKLLARYPQPKSVFHLK